MNEVSIIINGVRYDAIEEKDTIDSSRCDFYSKETHCEGCIIGMDCCEQLIGIDGVFKKSDKKFER
jgi:hypothetical protein